MQLPLPELLCGDPAQLKAVCEAQAKEIDRLKAVLEAIYYAHSKTKMRELAQGVLFPPPPKESP